MCESTMLNASEKYAQERALQLQPGSQLAHNQTLLARPGYFVIEKALHGEQLTSIKRQAQAITIRNKPLNMLKAQSSDGKPVCGSLRQQYKVKESYKSKTGVHQTKLFQDITNWITTVLDDALGGTHKAAEPVVLKSLPGCQQQPLHIDYINQTEVWKTEAPVITFTAFENNTHLVVVDNSVARPACDAQQNAKVLTLQAGDMVVAHLMLAHAGAASDCDNMRLFCVCSAEKPEPHWPVEALQWAT